MIDAQTAHQLVTERLARMERRMHEFGSALPHHKDEPYLHLVIAQIIEYDFGWVFTYNTREYIETRDFTFALLGNAPFIVDRNDGQVYVTGTGFPLEHYVNQYREGIRKRA